MDENDWQRLLMDLTSPNETVAARALERAREQCIPGLRSYLYGCGITNPDTVEDVLQDTFIKIWKVQVENREAAHDKQMPSRYPTWVKYLRTIALRCYLDIWRKQHQEKKKLTELIRRIPDEELRAAVKFLSLLNRGNGSASLLDQANVLWLEMDAELSPETHRRQALAAQLYYMDDWPREEILSTFRASSSSPRLSLPMLEDWLVHPGVMRAVVYNELYFTNDRLAWHLLGRAEPVLVNILDQLSRSPVATSCNCFRGDHITPEVAVILWRYRYGMRPDDILKRADCPLDRQQLFSLLASLTARLPFNNQMAVVCSRFSTKLGTERVKSILAGPGLWQRLAFQYHYGEELTLPDICERLQGPAGMIGYPISAGNLNVWLSGKRLPIRLTKFCAPQYGDENKWMI